MNIAPTKNTNTETPLTRSLWNTKKDKELLQAALANKGDWKKISKILFSKPIYANKAKRRYEFLTNSKEITHRKKYTHKEDLLIVKYFHKNNYNWPDIASKLHDRTGKMVKNRYYLYIRKNEVYDSLLKEVDDYEKDGALIEDMIDEEAEAL